MLHLAVLHLLAQAISPNALTPFQWASQNIHMVAWPTICLIAWKASKAVTKFVDRLEKTIGQIDVLSTNHFPHIEQYLLEIKTVLSERKS